MMAKVLYSQGETKGRCVQEDFIAGEPVPIAGTNIAVLRVLGNNAGPMTGPGTNSYIVGGDRVAVVDPGPADPSHIKRLLEIIDGRPVEAVLVTHTHGDHSPGAALLLRHIDAQVVGLPAPLGSGQDPSFTPTRQYHDGESIHCGDFDIRLLHTPGHVSNHLCFLLQGDGVLFTGDHILEGTTPVILPPDGNMRDYLHSLQRLKSEPLRYLAPAHGRVMNHPFQEIEKLLRHRMRREAKIKRVLTDSFAAGALSTEALNRRVYDDVPEHLLPWAMKTLQAHLIKLKEDGEALETGAGWIRGGSQDL